jgi:putative ABC transport system permease protein
MTLVGLSFAYLRDRALNTALNVLLLALAVATLVILILFSAQLGERFERDARGIDLVVGAKGSPLQLILSSIYQVDVPTGNIPLGTMDMLRRDPTVAKVIPLAQGDNFRGFRIVGTEPAYAEHYGATLVSGSFWSAPSETVIGAEVAAQTGARIGQRFEGSHGLGSDGGQEHAERPFVVTGILRPTGSVIDRLILTSVESVWDVHGIAHGDDAAHDEAGQGHDDHAEAAAADGPKPEVTALLVTYRSALAAVRLPSMINRQTALQAAVPAVETTRLLSLIGVGLDAVKGFAALLMLTGGLSIFVALYTALRQREGDMAMLRVMGAKPSAIFGQILLEGLLLAAGGVILGLALGHGVVAVAAASFGQLNDIGLTALRFEPAEAVVAGAALALGALSALIPALRVFRVDIANTLVHTA